MVKWVYCVAKVSARKPISSVQAENQSVIDGSKAVSDPKTRSLIGYDGKDFTRNGEKVSRDSLRMG